MKGLVIGRGGREHALALALQPDFETLYVAPGNAGTDDCAENVDIQPTDVDEIVKFSLQNKVDIVIVGPDDALAAGVVDELKINGIAAFGPTQRAARIESSKVYSKTLMKRKNIPTARFQSFDKAESAKEYVDRQDFPLYVKADGLALGKGALPCKNLDQARQAIEKILVDKKFGRAGERLVIESFIDGPERSLHAFSDGRSYSMFPVAQDHKEIIAGSGRMTGGMGAIAPVPGINKSQIDELGRLFVAPALEGLREDGNPFQGLLYPGIKGFKPKALEYNARFGDPETQVYMRLLKSNLLKTIIACVDGRLDSALPEWSDESAVCVVLASEGYPESSTKGIPLEGLEEAAKQPGIVVYHAGTAKKNGELVTSGGRVASITSTGDTLETAIDNVYKVIDNYINTEHLQFRRDIGLRALEST